jgi:hypothetical protein
MKRPLLLGLALVFLFVAVVLAPSALGYDRKPVRVTGLTPDSWAQSITKAEAQLKRKFPGIQADYCVGAIMVGYESESSFLHGTTRYWDKLVCIGTTVNGRQFDLIFDAKSLYAFVIYRLHGAAITDLQA